MRAAVWSDPRQAPKAADTEAQSDRHRSRARILTRAGGLPASANHQAKAPAQCARCRRGKDFRGKKHRTMGRARRDFAGLWRTKQWSDFEPLAPEETPRSRAVRKIVCSTWVLELRSPLMCWMSKASLVAEKQATSGQIVRWEKEGANYEAVVEKNGKHWAMEINAISSIAWSASRRSRLGQSILFLYPVPNRRDSLSVIRLLM